VLEAAYANRSDIWSIDLIQPEGSRPLVLPAVAGFTRVCTYDRPGTIASASPDHGSLPPGDPSLGSRSDPVPQPRTAQDLVRDLHALLHVAAVPGPYVLVGHSLGGVVVRLYASAYPDEVAGLVLVDASHEQQWEQLRALLTPAQWAQWEASMQARPPEWAWYEDLEVVDLDASFAQVRQARLDTPLHPLPLVVLTAGRSDDPGIPGWPVVEMARIWQALQADLVTLVPHARQRLATESGHFIHQEQPALVIDAVRQVVAAVRDPSTWNDSP
jgi:pimeloyl-ACP methyl ester carboxylesterase